MYTYERCRWMARASFGRDNVINDPLNAPLLMAHKKRPNISSFISGVYSARFNLFRSFDPEIQLRATLENS